MAELIDRHRAEIFQESAVREDVAAARGYRTLTGTAADRDLLAGMGFKPFLYDRDDAYPALLVPMHNAHGEHASAQVKPFVPRTRAKSDGCGGTIQVPVKYESPSGRPQVIDVPEFTRAHMTNLGIPLWITEGMKKTDALVSQGMAAIGLTGVFNWRSKLGTLGDWEDVPVKGRPIVLCFDADASTNRNVQLAMGRLGAWLRSRGASVVHFLVVPESVNGVPVKGVDDYFAAGGTVQELAACATDVPPGQGAVDAAFTDAFLVEPLASEALEGKYTWAAGLGWLKWSGMVWSPVSDVDPTEAVRQWCSGKFDAVLAEQAKDKSKNLTAQIAGWRGVLSRSRISALTQLARGVIGVQSDAAEFDADPDLFTVTNGTVHLPTGTLRPHDPADRITLCAGTEYRPGYTHPVWDKALSALPETVHPFYGDRMGQSITGYKTPDHKLIISHGDGENGKSTLTAIMNAVCGGYGRQIADRVLLAQSGDHPTELMDLRGLRYAVLEETPDPSVGGGRHLNIQRIKQTVGTPEITARRMKQDTVTFKTTHSLFINTNHRPVVVESDHGTWRRLALLEFPYRYMKPGQPCVLPTDRPGDPAMEYAASDPDVLCAALTWLVAGAQAWYARGRMMLPLPEAVEESTRKWRAETDLVMGFMDECAVADPAGFVPTKTMLDAFNAFLDDRGHRPWNDKTLGGRLGTHDAVKQARIELKRKSVNGKQQRGWTGVRLENVPAKNPFAA